jgi:hypothetical protein
MPFKSKAQPSIIRKCKYCDRPALRNIINGRNKGWLRTCGREECLTNQYRIAEVSALKTRPVVHSQPCQICKAPFIRSSGRQIWCKTCIPSQKWRNVFRRYGISKPQWIEILGEQGGHCALCLNEAKVTDHDHKTGKLRGLLCPSCNLLLAGLDADPTWFARATKYIGNR